MKKWLNRNVTGQNLDFDMSERKHLVVLVSVLGKCSYYLVEKVIIVSNLDDYFIIL